MRLRFTLASCTATLADAAALEPIALARTQTAAQSPRVVIRGSCPAASRACPQSPTAGRWPLAPCVRRFLLIDKDLHRSGFVRIHVRGGTGTATVERLVGRGPATTAPVYIGGETFGSGPTVSAQLVGSAHHQTVTPKKQTYTFYIRRATAPVLVVPASSC